MKTTSIVPPEDDEILVCSQCKKAIEQDYEFCCCAKYGNPAHDECEVFCSEQCVEAAHPE